MPRVPAAIYGAVILAGAIAYFLLQRAVIADEGRIPGSRRQ